jgi:putative hydrolase of the HAD superfamily
MPIKAVLFDMFDTLMLIEKDHAFYSPAVKSMHSYLVKNGIQVSFATFRDAYIKSRDALYETADQRMEEPHFDLRVKNALLSLGYTAEAESEIVKGATEVFCREFMNYVSLDEYAVRVLRELRPNYHLGVVSNFAIPECVTKLLEKSGLSGFLDVVIISASVNLRKPNPAIFKCALEKLQLEPEETVFVGDTVDADVKGGKEVGMKTVYLDRRPQKDLDLVKPDLSIKSLSELPAALTRLSLSTNE